MATIVLNHLSCQPWCLVFHRNSLKKVPKQKWDLWNGYVDDGFDMIEEQREGYMRELHDVMLLHFRDKPEDPWQLKYIWDYHTTPEEVYNFFGYNIHNLKEPIYIENIDPWICFTEHNDLVLYFGEDKPILKTKSSKICTKHAKIWSTTGRWCKEDKNPVIYKYWDVKDKSKLLFCGVTSIERVFPEFDWANIDPYGKCIRRIDIGAFRASDPYDYSDEEKAEILRKKAEEEERKRKYLEELEKRKNTPGYCCRCGAPHAGYVPNPYDRDMYGKINYEWLCDSCYSNIAGDI